MCIEYLEIRRHLAATAYVSSRGTLLVQGTSAADEIQIRQDALSIEVDDSVNARMTFSARDVKRIRISCGDGDDAVVARVFLPVDLLGEAGNDRLEGGDGNDTFTGGDGADTLVPNLGNDDVSAISADDVVDYSTLGASMVFDPVAQKVYKSHPGVELHLEFSDGDIPRALNRSTYVDSAPAAQIIGSPFGDLFRNQASNAYLTTIWGRGGDDYFASGYGGSFTTCYGEAGNDTFYNVTSGGLSESYDSLIVYGGRGDDVVTGLLPGRAQIMDMGAGIDTWSFGESQEDNEQVGSISAAAFERVVAFNGVFYGTDGPDVMIADGGNGSVIGGAGDDVIQVSFGSHTVYGGGGDDTLTGGDSTEFFFGEAGDDSIRAAGGDDRIDGGSGNDTLDGGAGDDRIAGQSGNDLLIGGKGRDRLDGGSGADSFIAKDGRVDTLLSAGAEDATIDEVLDLLVPA